MSATNIIMPIDKSNKSIKSNKYFNHRIEEHSKKHSKNSTYWNNFIICTSAIDL